MRNSDEVKRILIVDDNQENRYTVTRYLRRAGFETLEAATGYEGLRLIEENPALILLDIKLPDIVGWEVCRRIKSDPRTSSIPVLFTSATFIRTRDRVHGLEEGADGYLTVPIEPEELVATVRALLRMREAEAAAHSLAHQWRTTFDAITDGVCLLNTEGRVERCNKRFALMAGLKPAEVPGKKLGDLSPALREGDAFVRAMVSSGRRAVEEISVDGRWYRFTMDPVRRFDGNIEGGVCIVSDIDERKRVEQQLARQHSVTLTIADNAASCLFLLDENAYATFMNRAAEEVTGYTLKEIHARPLHEVIRPRRPDGSEGPPEECAILAAIEGNRRLRNHEDIFLRKDGVHFPVVCSLTPLVSDGVVTGAVLEFRDVTEDKRAEQTLRDNEERFRLVNLATNDVIWDYDLRTGRLHWNDAVRQTFGFTPEEMGEGLEGWLDRIHPDDRERVHNGIKDAFAGKLESWSDEYRFLRKDGSYGIFLDRGFVSREEGELPSRIIGSMLDLTRFRKIEAELRQTQERYRFLAETMPQMVWMATPEGSVDYYNQRWGEFSGTPVEVLLGDGWRSIIHPEDDARTLECWKESLASGNPHVMEHRFRRHDGEYRWMLTRGIPFRDSDGSILRWFGTTTDVDDQKRTEQALQEAKEQLTRYAASLEQEVSERTAELQNTVEELEAFCYTIAHDLRAPLRAMEGFTRALVEDYEESLDDMGREYARRTNDAARRMDHLIKDLLEYSRLSRVNVELEPVNLNIMLRGLLRQKQDEIEHSEATVEISGDLPTVLAHPVLMDQILGNLLSNALKFVDPGTRPRVIFRAEAKGGAAPDLGGGQRDRHFPTVPRAHFQDL